MTGSPQPPAPGEPDPVRSVWSYPGMPAMLAATALGFSGYAVLLAVSPMWAVRGGADSGGAGLVNGVLLLVTVLTQLVVPTAISRFGWGPVLATGMALLGTPSLLHPLSDDLGPTLALSGVRGIGFGVLTVIGSAAVAELTPPARRGAAIGAYGLAIAGPQVILLPLGPWLAESAGYWPVFLLGALPVLAIAPSLAVGRALRGADIHHEEPVDDGTPEVSTGRVAVRLLRPMTVLLGVTLAGGAILSFAPQMIESALAATVGLALLGLTSALSRWQAGTLSDRVGTARITAPLVVLTVVSMGLCALAVRDGSAALLLVAVALLGVSYGGLQNVTLVDSFALVTRRHVPLASSVWNIGFDLGTGIGSVLVGLVAADAGFPFALVVTAVIAALTLPLTIVRRRALEGSPQP